jgi:hypothetical protein
MNDLYQFPGLLLLAIFAFGLVAGLLLAVGIMYLSWFLGRQTDKRSRANEERAALEALAEHPVEIDDTRMLCARCWEDRHPGQVWSLRISPPLCAEHQHAACPEQDREDQHAYVLHY